MQLSSKTRPNPDRVFRFAEMLEFLVVWQLYRLTASPPARGRGLKPFASDYPVKRWGVAPRAGARIETSSGSTLTSAPWKSPPARGRGLKHVASLDAERRALVAPRAGARIETVCAARRRRSARVAPRAGARIETLIRCFWCGVMVVAPRAGARIETGYGSMWSGCWPRRPPRGGAD